MCVCVCVCVCLRSLYVVATLSAGLCAHLTRPCKWVAGAKLRRLDCLHGLKQLQASTLQNLSWLTRLQCCNACVFALHGWICLLSIEFTPCRGELFTVDHPDNLDHSMDCVSVPHRLISGLMSWQQTKLRKQTENVLQSCAAERRSRIPACMETLLRLQFSSTMCTP